MRFAILFSILLSLCSSVFASDEWMQKQISEDLTPFQNGFCSNCMIKYFEENKDDQQLCLFSITNNKIKCRRSRNIPADNQRLIAIHWSLREIAKKSGLPDAVFVVSLHDSLDIPSPYPIFVMSKKIGDQKVLFPDFEALVSRYQVINGVNLETTDFHIPWAKRRNKLIWRGSGAQGDITPENMHTKSRVLLCQLGREYPSLINAGFTRHIPPCLEQYRKDHLSFEAIFSYKYQIWLDGNAASYSNSGWRLYTGSTVIKTDSNNIQWYYAELKPWVHYVPVKENLENLVETLLLLKDNEPLAMEIGANGLQFAREHISKQQNLKYFSDLIWAYSTCPTSSPSCTCQ